MDVKAKCPACKRQVKLPRFLVATTNVRRTCRCKAVWSVTVVPLNFTGTTSVHAASFTRVR